jgi:diguanylate cyclase (GGDEF)-like protein
MRFRASNLVLLGAIVVAIAAAVLFTDRAQESAGNKSFVQGTENTEVQDSMHNLVTATEGYVSSGNPALLGQYEGAQLKVERALVSLEDVTSGGERAAVAGLAKAVRSQQQLDARAVHARQATGRPDSLAAERHRTEVFTKVIDANKEVSSAIDHRRRSAQTRTSIVSLSAVALLGFVIIGLGLSARSADRRRRRIRLFGEGLQAARTESEAYELVQAHLQRSVDGAIATVFNRNNSADRLEPATPVDPGSEIAKAIEGAKPDDCLAVRTAKPSTGGTGPDDLLRCDICGKTGGKSLCVPSIVGGEVIGSVLIRRGKSFDESAERSVSESVAEAAPVVAHLRNLAIAERRASSDKLTGLPNKRAAEDTLKQLIANSGRTASPLAAIVFDLDHFKQINDKLGHPKGDEVLAAVGSVVKGTLRNGDFAARFGGEEFLVLLPESNREAGRKVAEKLRMAIAGLRIPEVSAVQASFGVASLPEDADGREELLRLADRSLYAAKRSGRNKVETAAVDTRSRMSPSSNGDLTSEHEIKPPVG